MKKAADLILTTILFGLFAISAALFVIHFLPEWNARNSISQQLNDPASAQFKRLTHFPKTGATCGYVNAKNRMGAYVGFTQFVLLKDGEFLPEPESFDGYDDARKLQSMQNHLDWLIIVSKNCTNNIEALPKVSG